jgi:hypothetical protein
MRLGEAKIMRVGADSLQTIDLSPFLHKKAEYILSDMIDTMIYIPLETKKESLMAHIDKIIATEDRFFIMDSSNQWDVFIFDAKGKFIAKIKEGGGPEEIGRPFDIAFDEQNQWLAVYSNPRKITFFDKNGNFMKYMGMPLNFMEFIILPENYLFFANGQSNHLAALSNHDFQIYLTDKNFRIVSAGFPAFGPHKAGYTGNNLISKYKDRIYVTQPLNDTVFTLDNNGILTARYFLDFKGKGIPEKLKYKKLKHSKQEVLSYFQILRENDFYYYDGGILENSTHQVFTFNTVYECDENQSRLYVLYRDKSSGKMAGGDHLYIKNERDFVILNPVAPLAAYEDKFISWTDPVWIDRKEWYKDSKYQALPKKSRAWLENLDEDANPVLIMYKLNPL